MMTNSQPITRPPSRARHPSQFRVGGFTLIEVLVALAILAVALAAGIGLVSQSINTSAGLRDRTLALWVAQDRLREHQLLRDWPSPDTRNGVSTMAGRDWPWQEQVISTAMQQIRRIEIEVQHPQSRDVLAKLTGFLREPPRLPASGESGTSGSSGESEKK